MKKNEIIIGSRKSPLAQAQVQEVIQEIRIHHPNVSFGYLFVDTHGDLNLQISLRTLDKTDFFTREVDDLLLAKQCRIAVHSAKDLPEPLPSGMKIVALTVGKDPSDSLVLRDGETLETLPSGARIATSSVRREEAVRQMRPDLTFVDLRGTIGHRLAQLSNGQADGVVIAEAALIRLGLSHLNRIKLQCETAPYQGQLAIAAREDDQEMASLFSCIDTRRNKFTKIQTILYLGIELPVSYSGQKVIHYPVIKIEPRSREHPEICAAFAEFPHYTHLIFTSKSAVGLFFEYAPFFGITLEQIQKKVLVAVGHATAEKIQRHGAEAAVIAKKERAEGVIEELMQLNLSKDSYLFWPHSSLARDILLQFFKDNQLNQRDCIFYDTIPQLIHPLPDLNEVDVIVFTSPSTIDGFLKVFKTIPKDKEVSCIGPITQTHYNRLLN